MSDLTQLLNAASTGDRDAAAKLLPIVYDELRILAAARMANEPAGHTLSPTALVHEAYLRLIGVSDEQKWEGRAHFFGAAAEAMRRVLVDAARRKKRVRHGGNCIRVPLVDVVSDPADAEDDLLAVDQVVDELAQHDQQASQLVKLHMFAGLTLEQSAATLGMSTRTGYRKWAYARAWMFQRLCPPQS